MKSVGIFIQVVFRWRVFLSIYMDLNITVIPIDADKESGIWDSKLLV